LVKDATTRTTKYQAKNDADAVRIRFTNLKASMDTNVQSKQAEIADIQASVRDVLDSAGIAAILSVPYQAVGMKLYGLSNRFGGVTFQNEAKRYLDNYSSMGLTEDVLIAIAALFGVTWSAP
jgi:hypothetical protein